MQVFRVQAKVLYQGWEDSENSVAMEGGMVYMVDGVVMEMVVVDVEYVVLMRA